MPNRPETPGFITELKDLERRLRDTERQILFPDDSGDEDLQVTENGSPLGPVNRLDFGPGISAVLLGDRYVQVSGGSRSYATFVVAASDTSPQGKDSADFVCTGTNDQITIMEALAALPIINAPNDFPANTIQRGRVLLLEGTFILDEEIVMSGLTQVSLSGIGPGSILVTNTATASGATIGLYDCDRVVLENFAMEDGSECIYFGDALSQRCTIEGIDIFSSSYAVHLDGFGHRVKNCKAQTSILTFHSVRTSSACSVIDCISSGTGVEMEGSDHQVVGCTTYFPTGSGFEVGDTLGASPAERITFSSCYVVNFGANQIGIDIAEGTGHSVIGCTVTTSLSTGSGAAIDVDPDASGCLVSHNYVDGQGGVGTGLAIGGTDCVVTGNIIEDMEDNGINVTSSRVHVEGNRVSNCDDHGIRITGGDDCSILNNYVYANSASSPAGFDGIHITTDADRTNIQGNTIRIGGGANNHRYAINIATSSCDETLVCNNDTLTGFVTAAVNDAGTNTRLCSATGGTGAPSSANYLVGTADGTLTSEIVVGTTPGGELGNTWASPTVDTIHSGSAHTDFVPVVGHIQGHVIEDEGTPLTQRANVNFVGAGVTVTDSAPDTVVTIPGGGHVIEDEGVAMPAQPNLNFVGAGVTVTDSGPDTIVTIPGGGVGGGDTLVAWVGL